MKRHRQGSEAGLEDKAGRREQEGVLDADIRSEVGREPKPVGSMKAQNVVVGFVGFVSSLAT